MKVLVSDDELMIIYKLMDEYLHTLPCYLPMTSYTLLMLQHKAQEFSNEFARGRQAIITVDGPTRTAILELGPLPDFNFGNITLTIIDK